MTAVPFTAGPWFVREHRTSFGINGGPDKLNIATVTLGYNRKHRYNEKLATAKAIAALPALVEALLATATGSPPEKVSLYDEEGVEGWRWTLPDGRELHEIGAWDEDQPPHPLAVAALKLAGVEL